MRTPRVHHASRRRGGRVAARGARAAARADAADRRADGVCRERPGRTGLRRGVPGGTPEARVGGGPQHPDRHSLGDAATRRRCNDSRRNSSRCSPTSFFRKAHPPLRRCCNKRAPSPSFSRSLPIRSAAASSRAFRGRAATSPVSPIWSRRWPASGWSCSRRLRRASTGSPSCSTRQRRHMPNIT